MRAYTKAMVSFGILVILIIGLYSFTDWFSKTTGYVLGEDEKVRLAQCLQNQNAVLYVASPCPACDEQLALFGAGASELLYVQTCTSVSVCPRGAPSWNIKGEAYYGVQSLEHLIEISGCAVTQ